MLQDDNYISARDKLLIAGATVSAAVLVSGAAVGIVNHVTADYNNLSASRQAVVAQQVLRDGQYAEGREPLNAVRRVQDFLTDERKRVSHCQKNGEQVPLNEDQIRTYLNLNQLVNDQKIVFGRRTDNFALAQFIDQAEPIVDGLLLQLLQQDEQQRVQQYSSQKKSKMLDTFKQNSHQNAADYARD